MRTREKPIIQELAWALFLTKNDAEKHGFRYGPLTTVNRALKRYKDFCQGKDDGLPKKAVINGSIHDGMKASIIAYMTSNGINVTKYGLLYRHLRFTLGFNISYPMLKKVLHTMPEVVHRGHAKGWALINKKGEVR